MDGSHLEVSPKDLRFRADNKKQPPTVMYLSNRADQPVAFKVKTTAPKRYCVKPSADVVGPNTTLEVKVFMQQSKDLNAAAAAECKDKFLIQSTPVPFDWSVKSEGDGKSADYFNRKENPKLHEEKLRVTLEAPPQPPSPVPEASETAELNSADAGHTTGLGGGYSSSRAAGTAAPGALPASGNRAEPSTVDEYRTENRKLREQLALAELRSSEMSAKVGPSGTESTGLTLLHLLLVAIVSYILGIYLR